MRSERDWGVLAASEAPTVNNPMTEISAYLRMVAARFIANGALLSCSANQCRDGHHSREVGFGMFVFIGGGCDGDLICSGGKRASGMGISQGRAPPDTAIPRGMDLLHGRNRLNVAIARAYVRANRESQTDFW